MCWVFFQKFLDRPDSCLVSSTSLVWRTHVVTLCLTTLMSFSNYYFLVICIYFFSFPLDNNFWESYGYKEPYMLSSSTRILSMNSLFFVFLYINFHPLYWDILFFDTWYFFIVSEWNCYYIRNQANYFSSITILGWNLFWMYCFIWKMFNHNLCGMYGFEEFKLGTSCWFSELLSLWLKDEKVPCKLV